MDLRHLRYFLAIADERSFRRAAERMAMTQPPLSRDMHELERELGFSLFDRSRRPIALTPAGEAFADEARAILDRLANARRIAEQAAQHQRPLRVGFLGAAADGILPIAVRRFRHEHPHTRLLLQELESGLAQLAQLRDRRIDLALVRASIDDSALEFRLVLNEAFVAVVPTDHALASRTGPVSLSELVGEPFIFWPRDAAPTPFDVAHQAFAGRGLHLQVTQEALGIQAILGLVSAGLGVSLLPASVTSLHREGVVTKPITDPEPTIPLLAGRRTDNDNPALDAFLGILVDAVRTTR